MDELEIMLNSAQLELELGKKVLGALKAEKLYIFRWLKYCERLVLYHWNPSYAFIKHNVYFLNSI